jgi:hypothetical protein
LPSEVGRWPNERREGEGDALRYAQEAVSSGYEAVIVAGDDGTVNEVVSGLVRVIIPRWRPISFKGHQKGEIP